MEVTTGRLTKSLFHFLLMESCNRSYLGGLFFFSFYFFPPLTLCCESGYLEESIHTSGLGSPKHASCVSAERLQLLMHLKLFPFSSGERPESCFSSSALQTKARRAGPAAPVPPAPARETRRTLSVPQQVRLIPSTQQRRTEWFLWLKG